MFFLFFTSFFPFFAIKKGKKSGKANFNQRTRGKAPRSLVQIYNKHFLHSQQSRFHPCTVLYPGLHQSCSICFRSEMGEVSKAVHIVKQVLVFSVLPLVVLASGITRSVLFHHTWCCGPWCWLFISQVFILQKQTL